ncbi:hypothetical protein [Falsiroseomonas tokyonensis]|uniref:Uncharacterized protein n=1 Tax=Falsiroseomonas tokyonensis TaxID=430521 RepID=A0ABV7C300_9PROT|nr:hypothetical protein [Falsiroseomonas tokyonensis]MBU8540837.1 hypothetical protein [Falsiroseomonas tokyonensis]
MTAIIDEPHLYEVRRDGRVIAIAVQPPDGIWRSAAINPAQIKRHARREDAVQAARLAAGVFDA